MQFNRKVRNSFWSPACGMWGGLFILLALCLGTLTGNAQSRPIVVSSQGKLLGYFPGGGWSGSQTPLSSSFGVGPNGDVLIADEWGNDLLEISQSGTVTKLAAVSNSGPAAVDAYGNAYVSYDGYNGSIYKVPYDPSKGTYTGFTTAPTVNCVGTNQDAAPCLFAPNFKSVFTNGSGYSNLVFDASGNLFIVTSTVPTDNPNTIYKCDATCQTSPTGTPVKIYAGTKPIGALAVDPWGNLFFSDGENGQNKVSYLNEIPFTAGSYAASPTVLESYTNKLTYGNGFSGVVADGAGTIYFAINGEGVFAVPNTKSGGPNLAGLYKIANSGGYGIALDRTGNLYVVFYGSNPPSGSANTAVQKFQINNLSLGALAVGQTTAATTVSVIDNSASCTPTLAMAATQFGVTSTEFAVTAGTDCAAALGTSNGTFSPAVSLTGAVTSATITFTPAKVGARQATFSITNSATTANGAAALTGIGQGVLANVDPATITGYKTGLTAPSAAIADAAGNIFIADSGAGKVYEIALGTTTLTSVGSGFTTPWSLAFDANGNLFVADSGIPAIIEISNTGVAGSFVPGAQSTIATTSTLFGGTPLGVPAGIAFGPDGLLYIADLPNARVVTYNPSSRAPGVLPVIPALKSAAAVAVGSAAAVYVADDSLNQVFVLSPEGTVSTVAPAGLTKATGIAVDPSGSVFIADAGGNLVRVPAISATLDSSKAIVIENDPQGLQSISLGADGTVYAADMHGAYAVQRTAAAVDIGTVQDGVTNSSTVFLMNAGNQTSTLASPAVVQPSNTMFTLTPGNQDGCTDGITGPAGASCQFTATFAPAVGTPAGLQTGTASIQLSPSGSIPVTLTGTASVSSIKSQAITGFAPASPILVGQQVALTAVGGGSGNPVVFTIDSASSCKTCAAINGTTLSALVKGTVIVDANQAGGANNGEQYAAAPQVQATIVISAAGAAGVPSLIMTQKNWLGTLPTGGAFGGSAAGGSTFGVTPDGNNIVLGTSYGGSVETYDLKAGAFTRVGKFGNTGGIAVDPQGNAYVSGAYSGTILKIPYANGKFASFSDPTVAGATVPAHCTGTDTAACTAISGVTGISGVAGMTFDAQGNLFISTDDQGAAHSIWKCTVPCLNTGTPAPEMLFQEPSQTNPLYIGGLAVDLWGNIFFTDSEEVDAGASKSASSNLKELKYTSGIGYAASPVVLQTFTNKTVGSYDDEMDGVVTTADGTIYYALQYDGVYAVPNTQAGGPDIAHQYVVQGQGAKEIAIDAKGNAYFVSYNGGDALGQLLINNLTTPLAQLQGAPVTASANVIDNLFGCGTPATLAIASSDSQFSATAGNTCSGISVSSNNGTLSTPVTAAGSYTASINFAATKGGQQHSTLTVTDSANGGLGTAIVTGIGQQTPQTITFTLPLVTTYTYAPGLTVTIGATGGGSHNPVLFTVDTGSTTTGAGTITGNTLTVTQAGTIIIDANEVGGLVNGVYYDNATQAQLTLTIDKAAQAITFAGQGTAATYAPGLTITMTAAGGSSTSPVVFSVDASSTGAGTVSGNVLTVTQAGDIVVNANQAADANYLAAPQVQQTFKVNKAAQSITFIALTQPLHYIAGGLQVQISATGGATNLPIVFTVDAASPIQGTFATSTVTGATSTATLTLMDQASLANFPANILINASQPGNSNYSDATQASETIQLLKPLPTQKITFDNPGTQVAGAPFALAAAASSGFPVTYTASPAAACTVSASDAGVWTASFTNTNTTASTCTITAYQPGDNIYFAAARSISQTFAVNPAGQVPSMTMNLSLSSLTIQKGTVGLTQITMNSVNNFTGQVSLACSGAPSGYTCGFNPSTISAFTANTGTGLPLGTTGTSQLSISGGSTAALHNNSRPLFPAATLAVALCLLGFRKRNRLQLMLLAIIAVAGLGIFTGCSSSTSKKTQGQTSQVTITATSGKATQTSTLTIILE
jgi:sugar lactone lactonase YvrE